MFGWTKFDKAWIGGFLGTWLASGIVQIGEKMTGMDISIGTENWLATSITGLIVGGLVFMVKNK